MDLTTSRVNRAGVTLRRWWASDRALYGREEVQAFEVLRAFRAAHSTPLTKGNNGLRSMLRTEDCNVEVSQRLKRTTTILDKLTRQPTMALSRMQDIGGCGPSSAQWRKSGGFRHGSVAIDRPSNWTTMFSLRELPATERSTWSSPTTDAALRFNFGPNAMHDWAVAVEQLGGRIGEDLKSGRGPARVLHWLSAVSDALGVEESGEVVDTEHVNRIAALREAAMPFLRGSQL